MIPATIYHYTGLVSMMKIIESGRIRATHYSDFADSQELILGVRLLLDAIRKHPTESHDREYRDFLIEGIKKFATGELQVFVLSFTELADSQHNWQTYANQGVAIGFCRDRIQKGFPIDISHRVPRGSISDPIRPDPANRFMQCRYVSRLDLAGLVASRFFTTDSYPAIFRHPLAREHKLFDASLTVSIYQTICAIKGDAFFEDAEWRCVHINPDPIAYPIMQTNNRRFIEMQFSPAGFIRELWIGRHDRHEDCLKAAEAIAAGLPSCSIRMSDQTAI